jgi:hypothetical protein
MAWEELSGIVNEARHDHEVNQAREADPIDCPEHGWPLDIGPDGEKHCLFGGHVIT